MRNFLQILFFFVLVAQIDYPHWTSQSSEIAVSVSHSLFSVAEDTLGPELIINGDMELNTYWNAAWFPDSSLQSTDFAHGGSHSWKTVTPSGSGTASSYTPPQLEVMEDSIYWFDAYVYIVSGEARIEIFTDVYHQMWSSTVSGEWLHVSFSFVAENLTEPGLAYIYFLGNSGGISTFYIDDVSIKQRISAAFQNLEVLSPNGGENWLVGSTQNITWNSINVVDVKIEYSLNGGNEWLLVTSSTPANSGNFVWIPPDTASTQCKIKISDVINNSITDSSDNTFTITNTTFQFSVSYNNGWNLVSIPGLHPTDQSVDTWWQYRDMSTNVFKYTGGYVVVTTASPGTGYWMKHTGPRTYNTGEEWPAIQLVSHNAITGSVGWNLFSGYEEIVPVVELTTTPPGLISGPVYGYSNGYFISENLESGYGYFVKLTGAGQINIPEAIAKGNSKMAEWFKEDWGKIILTDAKGISYTLYAIKGEVNLNQYELPPAPPAGMFDIRYGSGRIAENINSSMQTIDMSGITFPLTVRVEGMDIRLMDETGKTINVNLKSGEDVVISDATIQKFMVTGKLIPATYALEQNYPNPFNPSTTIKFAILEKSEVNLSIYNMLGELISTLVNEQLIPGYYEYNFHASTFASGIYLYRIKAGNPSAGSGQSFVVTKKMVLLK